MTGAGEYVEFTRKLQRKINKIYMQGSMDGGSLCIKPIFSYTKFYKLLQKIVFSIKGRSNTLGYTHQCSFSKLV